LAQSVAFTVHLPTNVDPAIDPTTALPAIKFAALAALGYVGNAANVTADELSVHWVTEYTEVGVVVHVDSAESAEKVKTEVASQAFIDEFSSLTTASFGGPATPSSPSIVTEIIPGPSPPPPQPSPPSPSPPPPLSPGQSFGQAVAFTVSPPSNISNVDPAITLSAIKAAVYAAIVHVGNSAGITEDDVSVYWVTEFTEVGVEVHVDSAESAEKVKTEVASQAFTDEFSSLTTTSLGGPATPSFPTIKTVVNPAPSPAPPLSPGASTGQAVAFTVSPPANVDPATALSAIKAAILAALIRAGNSAGITGDDVSVYWVTEFTEVGVEVHADGIASAEAIKNEVASQTFINEMERLTTISLGGPATPSFPTIKTIVNPAPSPSPPVTTAKPPVTSKSEADPHFTGAEGGKFDFKGVHKKVYNLLSTSNMTINARITHDTFFSQPEANASEILVHGSYFTEAFVNMAIGTNRSMKIAYKAGIKQTSVLVIIDSRPHSLGVDSMLSISGKDSNDHSFTISSTKMFNPSVKPSATIVKHVKLPIEGERKLMLDNGEWTIEIKSMYYPLREKNGDKQRLDFFLEPRSLSLGKVAPHGLLGQTFDADNIAIDGARDQYGAEKVVTTKAMGEGAIEGVAKDYEIISHDPYSPTFKFSRWNLIEAAPRDISKLTGTKRHHKGKMSKGLHIEL
jgi:hypothetical protein